MSERPTRILHVLGRMNPGGVEIWLMHLLRYIDRRKYHFDFCTLSGLPGLFDAEIAALGREVIPCRLGRNPVSFARRFRHVLRDGRYDVVHSHVHHFSGAILRWAHMEHVPIRIAHSHNSSDGKTDRLWRQFYRSCMRALILRHASQGLAASREAAPNLFQQGWGRDSRFRILHCGIELSQFKSPVDARGARDELGIPLGAPVVGHVGSFGPQKNHRFLVEIAARIHDMRRDVRFLLVGDGPLRAEIQAKVHALNLSRCVHLVGIRSDVPRLMRACMDAFLFPSLWEGLPVVLIEAQAAGLRCVVSDAVTREVGIAGGGIQYVPLALGAGEWAERTLGALDGGRVCDQDAIATMTRTDFSIEQSMHALLATYHGAIRTGAHAAA